MTPEEDAKLARQGRIAALVMAGGGLLAILAPAIIQSLGLTVRHEILLYLFSLAAFFWALVVTFQIWQKRRK
ncbi:DUF5337 family protein [Nereida sp. MMG025]|uniref:DUF5337 domain-containing protein n=1 Tax=Nereida sp. MMG025 TaxID=2909981 RepID=UPI00351D2901|nr:DUF5337 domain-containing protein [Nereida sp. MMG025]